MTKTPTQAARETIRTLGRNASAEDLSDRLRELCPFDMDSDEGSEWVEDADNALAKMM